MISHLPTVSVVIPTYNQPALLLETLASVFSQTFEDYEVVVVNDGSTDDTAQRLLPLQQKYGEKMRVITQPNAGIGMARNRGLDEARGTYVALLDHDDLWLPEKLRVQVKYMQEHPRCVACGTLFSLSPTPQIPHFALEDVADARGIVERPFWQIVRGRDVFQTCTLMIDRQRCTNLRYGTKRNAMEDVSFHFKLLTRGLYGIAGDAILAIYRVFEANASKDPEYFYRGIQSQRQMQRAGEFDDLPAVQQKDMKSRLCQLGRISAVGQLATGHRTKAAELYVQEFVHQVADFRPRFLLVFPVMLLLPRSIVLRAYPQHQSR